MKKDIYKFFIIFFTLATFEIRESLSIDVKEEDEQQQQQPKIQNGYRLPDNIYPEYYRVEILTNLADLSKNYTFDGRVWIMVSLMEKFSFFFFFLRLVILARRGEGGDFRHYRKGFDEILFFFWKIQIYFCVYR